MISLKPNDLDKATAPQKAEIAAQFSRMLNELLECSKAMTDKEFEALVDKTLTERGKGFALALVGMAHSDAADRGAFKELKGRVQAAYVSHKE